MDESTTKSDQSTSRCIYEAGNPNLMEKPSKSYKKNFLAVLGINVESNLFIIKNLDEFEFAKALFRIKRCYTDSDEAKKVLDKVIGKCTLSKKDITKKFEEKEDNPEFKEKINRSLKNNKNDKSMVLSRKIGKHCKRYSTDNSEIRKEIKKNHYYELIEEYGIENKLKEDKLVLLLDNATSHTSDFVMNIAEKLNIQFVFMPKYAPWLNCVEKVWNIVKYRIELEIIRSSSELVKLVFKTFDEKCKGDSLTKKFKEKYLPVLC